MKRGILYLIIYVLVLGLGACDKHSDVKPRHPHTKKPDTLRRLVVVYMAADNSLSYMAEEDVAEMERAAGDIPEDCALAVYLDNYADQGTPGILLIDKAQGKRVVQTYAEAPVSTDSTAMQRVLADILAAFPAREHGLVLWSHSTGWTPRENDRRRTWGSERGHEMLVPTLAHVLRNTGVHWQFIFYDCCFMQCIEAAYQMRHVTDWVIAAPIEIPGEGAPYDLVMPHLFQAEQFARDIPAAYHDYYEQQSCGVILSAIRSDRLDNLARVTAAALDTLSHISTDEVQRYGAYAESTRWVGEFHDMASLMSRNLCPADYATWSAAMQQAIPHRFATRRWYTMYGAIYPRLTDPDHFAGTSMYIPVQGRTGMNEHWRTYDWARQMPQAIIIN